MRTALIIPTRNAAAWATPLIAAISGQTLRPDCWLVVDSGSTDNTCALFREAGAQVIGIDPAQFNHGGTREWARSQVNADVLIYLTQDAIPERSCFAELIQSFQDPQIGIAYARQLPRPNAGVFEAHARHFNYPEQARTKTLADAPLLGIKTCFSSDSCAAYRSSALDAVGGFPQSVIGSEDAYVAGKMLLKGLHVRYAAQARVEHSHAYRFMEEFRRYFDIGVFYGREQWISSNFGNAGGEGRRFVLSEIKALRNAGELYLLPSLVLRNGLKSLGYYLGRREARLPLALKRRISMFAGYWKNHEI